MKQTPVWRFWKLLSIYRIEIRQIYVYALFIGVINLSLPLGIQAIINYIQTGEMTSAWVVLVGFVLLGIAISGILQVLQLRVVENVQQDLFVRSAIEFAYRFPQFKFLQLDKIHAPELVNRFFDTLTIQKGLPKILIDFSLAAFQIIFGLILLAIYSPYFIILGFTLLFVLWMIFRITGPQGLSTSLAESKYKYRIAHWLEEIARVSRSFKMNASNRFHLERTDDIAVDYVTSRESHFRVLLNQFRLFIGFKVFVAAALLILGGVLVFQEQMNIGQFVAAEIIIILIINSVEKILRVIETIYDVLTALEKIGYVTDLELDEDSGVAELDTTGPLSVRAMEIQFGFPDARRKVLDGLSFSVRAGSKVVIEGTSGSGKSILLQILGGIHTVDDGEIYINDIPVSNYKRDSLFRRIGMAFPTNQLFEGTIQDNIVLGRKIPDKHLSEVIDLLGLSEFIAHQSKGINTHIDSGGRRIPRSIIQKLQIARILVGNPGLLLLEDPLQFVDEEEKRRIIDHIMAKNSKWTVIVVADHAYWKEKASQVITLEKPA